MPMRRNSGITCLRIRPLGSAKTSFSALSMRSSKGSFMSGRLLHGRVGRVFRRVGGRVGPGVRVVEPPGPLHGPGSEGGMKTCYIKFGAARGGPGAGDRFDRLLDACDAFASSRGVPVEAGVNLAREDAFRRMRTHGYRAMTQGVAMLRPNIPGFNRPDVYVIDDWR